MQQRQKDIHETLHFIASENHPYYLTLFAERKYSLIFRKACYQLNIELVELLLNCRHLIVLHINEASSNGHTALDWALESGAAQTDKMSRLVSMLEKAGAVTGAVLRSETDEDNEEVCDDHCGDACEPVVVDACEEADDKVVQMDIDEDDCPELSRGPGCRMF